MVSDTENRFANERKISSTRNCRRNNAQPQRSRNGIKPVRKGAYSQFVGKQQRSVGRLGFVSLNVQRRGQQYPKRSKCRKNKQTQHKVYTGQGAYRSVEERKICSCQQPVNMAALRRQYCGRPQYLLPTSAALHSRRRQLKFVTLADKVAIVCSQNFRRGEIIKNIMYKY